MPGQFLHLGFDQASNRQEIRPAISVFGEIPYSQFRFILSTQNEVVPFLCIIVEGNHPQTRFDIGTGQTASGTLLLSQKLSKHLVNREQINNLQFKSILLCYQVPVFNILGQALTGHNNP